MYPVVKRIIDVSGSTLLLVGAAPLLLALGAAIARDSPGSPLFVQERVGRHGKPFRMFKLRTMVRDAPMLGPAWTSSGDPRITRIGRWLRATSMDELPQLWNVLRGEMSLVGPRPCVASQRGEWEAAEWEQRHMVRPGMTGLAQVSGRSTLEPAQTRAMDLAYAANPTFSLDVRILLRTVLVVARRQGTN